MLLQGGSRRRGDGLAPAPEVTAMWFLPLTITLRMRRTRNSWLLELRVQLIV